MKDITRVAKINLDRLNNAELINFITRYLELIYEAKEGDVPATGKELGMDVEDVMQLEEELATMNDIVSQSRASHITAKLEVLHKDRVKMMTYFLSSVRIAKTSLDAAIREAGTSLYNVVKPYFALKRRPLQQLTVIINGLVIDANKPGNVAFVRKLSLGDAVEKLSTLNETYADLTAQRTNEREDNRLEDSKSVRARINPLYECTSTLAFATSVTAGNEIRSTFINHLNALIGDTTAQYNQRTAQTKRKPEEEVPAE